MERQKEAEYDQRYLKGIELFNNQEFFEAHEVWEDLWHETRGEARDFVQGLIQVTSSYHHVQTGNARGARILHDSGLELLETYGDSYRGVDLKFLREKFNNGLREILGVPVEQLAGRGHAGPVKIDYSPDRAFKIVLKR